MIVGGGDGTLLEVANGLWWEPEGRQPCLGAVSLGTACDYVRNFRGAGMVSEGLTAAMGNSTGGQVFRDQLYCQIYEDTLRIYGQIIERPEIVTQGSDIGECGIMLRDALREMVAAYEQLGKKWCPPFSSPEDPLARKVSANKLAYPGGASTHFSPFGPILLADVVD